MAELRGKLEVWEHSAPWAANGYRWYISGHEGPVGFSFERDTEPYSATEQAALAAGRAWAEKQGIELED